MHGHKYLLTLDDLQKAAKLTHKIPKMVVKITRFGFRHTYTIETVCWMSFSKRCYSFVTRKLQSTSSYVNSKSIEIQFLKFHLFHPQELHKGTNQQELIQIAEYYFDGQGKALRPMVTMLMGKAINYHIHRDNRLVEFKIRFISIITQSKGFEKPEECSSCDLLLWDVTSSWVLLNWTVGYTRVYMVHKHSLKTEERKKHFEIFSRPVKVILIDWLARQAKIISLRCFYFFSFTQQRPQSIYAIKFIAVMSLVCGTRLLWNDCSYSIS